MRRLAANLELNARSPVDGEPVDRADRPIR
jgi:hypothetical protein